MENDFSQMKKNQPLALKNKIDYDFEVFLVTSLEGLSQETYNRVDFKDQSLQYLLERYPRCIRQIKDLNQQYLFQWISEEIIKK